MNLLNNDDVEEGLLAPKHPVNIKASYYMYGSIPPHRQQEKGDQHTASCSDSSSCATSASSSQEFSSQVTGDDIEEESKRKKVAGDDEDINKKETSPLIIILPNQQSLRGTTASSSTITDSSCSSFSSSRDNNSSKTIDNVQNELKDTPQKLLSYQMMEYEDFSGSDDEEGGGGKLNTTERTVLTDWTVSESTVNTQYSNDNDDEKDSNCCSSFRSCGRGLSVPGWEAYNKSLDTHPVITKACTSLCGWFLGDFVAQTIITRDPFDVHRSMTLASFGFFFHGPVGHFIYDNLDMVIVGTGPKQIAAKIFIDQVLWCPVFMFCYFTYLGFANGDNFATILEKIHDDMFTAILGSWKLWPIAHAIQFRYVATKHRIVYINCIEVCFIMFLSFLGNQ